MQIDANRSDQLVIVMNRTFDAPIDVVWSIFVDPKHVKHWYGGDGFSNPVCEMDVRPGGLWHHVMRLPNGMEFAMDFVFIEVEKPTKLVWQAVDHDTRPAGGPPSARMTVTLQAHGQQTHWQLVSQFKSFADRDAANQIGFAATIAQGSNKLNELAKALRG